MQMSLVENARLISSPLNYIGGKYKLLPQILPLFPKVEGTFIDLFCGGCNVGINVSAGNVIFNDTDENLIYLYNTFKNLDKNILLEMIESIIEQYSLSRTDIHGYSFYECESSGGMGSYNKDKFLKLRDDFNNRTNFEYRYYVMLYVMIVYSFNNQIRFNKEGKFNLPVGKRDYNEKMQNKLVEFVDRIKDMDCCFTCKDFGEFDLSEYGKNDFIYADPPYLITCATYNEQDGWNEDKEKALHSFLDNASENGIRFALSNVISSEGKENRLLIDWLGKNKSRYNTIHLNYNYSNSNYQKKDRKTGSDEVLITNY